MEVDVIGGGPGGAYAALLVQKDHPDWRVSVYESYPAATTYGWGIVLPEKVYPTLRDADEPTCERIEAVNTTWDPIDTYHRGERIRCDGHPYTSVMRADLLSILQDRCAELGVDMYFETEADPAALRESSDLLVGADGLASDTRSAFSTALEPTLTRQSDVYAWFGTDASFDALSHVYVETDDGVWHAAAYPGSTDTFIVDTDEETWAAAGFDGASEAAYVPYLEDLFEDYLGNHGLRSKEDRWRHFVTVENERWYHENVVLLGDAAATAHYTIGSGTRMAMEGAIALADGLDRHPHDRSAALSWYEGERKPHVEALQSAAALSVTHFENIDRYVHLPPMQLAMLYLTRTGYNTYEALRERDPDFVAALDRWFARDNGVCVGAEHDVPQPMDQPFDLGGITLSNRVVVEPSPPVGATTDRIDDHARRVADLSTSGAGLVTTGPVAVSPVGRPTGESPGLYTDEQATEWSAALGATTEDSSPGAHVGVELVHAGRRGTHEVGAEPDGTLLAPSAIPYADGRPTPRSMDATDLDDVRADFVTAARRADDAGFDLLSVHVGRGYLLGSFLSPLSNEREDRYGGSPEARLRYPVEVVSAVRDAWPVEKPLAVTLQATDCVEGGYDVDDAFVAARAMQRVGVDLVAPVAGGTIPDGEPPTDHARYRLYAHWIKHEVGVPTLSTARITTRDEVNTLVASGRADLCRLYPEGGNDVPL